jgi:fused signal recognition particle receptor
MKFLQSLAQQFTAKPIDWDELEEGLIRADLGVSMTTRIMKTLQEREAWALLGIGDVMKAVREEIARILPAKAAPIRRAKGKPTVILIIGVNGTGKTITAKSRITSERSPNRDARSSGVSGCSYRTTRCWAEAWRRNHSRSVWRRSGRCLLRSVSGGGETPDRLYFAIRRAATHQNKPDGRAGKVKRALGKLGPMRRKRHCLSSTLLLAATPSVRHASSTALTLTGVIVPSSMAAAKAASSSQSRMNSEYQRVSSAPEKARRLAAFDAEKFLTEML